MTITRISPSSRLVLATVILALVALTLAGQLRPAPSGVTSSGSPFIAQATEGQPTGPDGTTTETGQPGAPTSQASDGITAPTATPSKPRSTPRPTPRPTAKPSGCKPTDQDRYVYNPDRLEVAAACIYITGTVDAVRKEADGDLHILVNLDPAYAYRLRPANQGEELGDLVVEPVCVRTVSQLDAEAACNADPDPLSPPFPVIGEHVWMEGRYVFDLDHGGWAELHPLYRWGYV